MGFEGRSFRAQAGALTTPPCCQTTREWLEAGCLHTVPACCWKCGPEGEVPADWDVTQNDYRVVHISVDSCARLEPGRSRLVQAESWV